MHAARPDRCHRPAVRAGDLSAWTQTGQNADKQNAGLRSASTRNAVTTSIGVSTSSSAVTATLAPTQVDVIGAIIGSENHEDVYRRLPQSAWRGLPSG